MSPQVVGYASSILLLFTIGGQLAKQWRSGNSKGVSPYLFVGQLCSSVGFTTYSALVHNAVFVITNACLAIAASLGIAIMIHHRRRGQHEPIDRKRLWRDPVDLDARVRSSL